MEKFNIWFKKNTESFLGKILACLFGVIVILPLVIFMFVKLWTILLPLLGVGGISFMFAAMWQQEQDAKERDRKTQEAMRIRREKLKSNS